MFWEVVGLERGPLSLVSTTEEIFGRKNSGSGLDNRDYGRSDSSRWPSGTLYPQKLALTSPRSGGRSVGIVRSRTQATEFLTLLSLSLWRSHHGGNFLPQDNSGVPFINKSGKRVQEAELHANVICKAGISGSAMTQIML
jgi:hypothetical protein